MLTPSEIDTLKALLRKATQGPWFVSRDPRPDMEWNNHIATVADPNIEICAMFHTTDVDDNETGEANAELIAKGISALPALLERLENLEAIIELIDEYAPRADATCEEPGITLSEAARRELAARKRRAHARAALTQGEAK